MGSGIDLIVSANCASEISDTFKASRKNRDKLYNNHFQKVPVCSFFRKQSEDALKVYLEFCRIDAPLLGEYGGCHHTVSDAKKHIFIDLKTIDENVLD